MIPDVYRELIDKLLDKSRERKANWKTTSKENQYFIAFGDYSILIGEYISQDYSQIGIELFDSEGTRIDSFYVDAGVTDFVLLDELFTLARRRGRRIDKAIEAIQSALEKSEEVGEDDAPPPGVPANDDDDLPF